MLEWRDGCRGGEGIWRLFNLRLRWLAGGWEAGDGRWRAREGRGFRGDAREWWEEGWDVRVGSGPAGRTRPLAGGGSWV